MLNLGIGLGSDNFVPPEPPLFGQKFGAAPVSGYSLRKLSTAYKGSCVRVRRKNDGTESDIGFNASNELDVSALQEFARINGGATFTKCTVTKWYDQIGSNDLVQATAGNQPAIFDGASGSTILLNSKPCIEFTASTQHHLESSTEYSASATASTVFFVAQTTQKSGSGNFISMINFRNIFRMTLAPSGLSPDNYSKYSISTNRVSAKYVRFLTGQTGDHDQQTAMITWDGSTQDSGTSVDSVKLFLNGSSQTQTFATSGFGTLASGNILNGHSGGNDGQSGDAKWQEVVVYTNDRSSDASSMHSDANDFYSIT